MTEMDTRLTHSQRRCLDTCKRKHYLAYVLRIRPRTDGRALRIGSAVHHGIHLWTMGKPRETAVAGAIERFDAEAPSQNEEAAYQQFLYDRQTVAVLVSLYFERWRVVPWVRSLGRPEILRAWLRGPALDRLPWNTRVS